MAYVRTVKTSSGATAVQIVWSSRKGSRSIEHLGSAHDDVELAALKAAAAERLAAGQTELDLGISGHLEPGTLPILSSQMTSLWETLCVAYRALGFESAAKSDNVFRDLVLARIIEPTSKIDAERVLTEVGLSPASYATVKRRLPRYAKPGWRQALAAVSAAHAKARGGMFAQLCTDLPWTQHLSEVWRMTDPDERQASLALRDGEPKDIRSAVDWYRTHNRLHCGDATTMAADALAAYSADTALGRDALLVCDTTEMADALNQRLHQSRRDRDAPTVTAARGQKIGVGDLIITRRNDPTIDFHLSTPNAELLPPVRNGDRWWVAAVDSGTNRLAAERMTDGARAVFDGAYLCEHVNLGYAVTTHSAQGVTCDSTRAVPSDSASRSLFYVAVTRGRTNNNVYLYENAAESDAAPTEEGRHRPIRGSDGEAADLARAVLARDDRPVTAHQAAAVSPASSLPSIVVNLLEAHRANVSRWRDEHSLWRDVADRFTVDMSQARSMRLSRTRERDHGLEL